MMNYIENFIANDERAPLCDINDIACADGTSLFEGGQENADEDGVPAKRRRLRQRKCKNRLTQLSDKFPGTSFTLTGLYGPPDNQKYVMDISIDGQVFQGIGQSKIKAKIMAAEFALMHFGMMTEPSEQVPPITPDNAEDYTSDVTETPQFYNFDKQYLLDDDNFVPWILPEKVDMGVPVIPADMALIPADVATILADNDNIDSNPAIDIDDEDFRNRLLGKTPLTIVGELQLGAFYSLVDETGDQLHPMFAMSVTINDETFYGAGTSKKLAKARAARNALQKLYNIHFSVTENGMPIYEGDDQIWQETRKKLRKEALSQLQPGRNPLIAIAEVCPDAKYEVESAADESHLFTSRLTVLGKTFTCVGTTKTDAKTNVATNALEELRKDNHFMQMLRQSIAHRREQRASRQLDLMPLAGSPKNAVAKLNLLFRGGVEFHDIAETPVPHTPFVAFTVAVGVDGRYFVGVGKTKKQARLDAAERALKVLGAWTAEDDAVKWDAAGEIYEDPVAAVQRMRDRAARERANAVADYERSMSSGWNQRGGARDWNSDQSDWGADYRGWEEKQQNNVGWGRGSRYLEDWNEGGWNEGRHGQPGAWSGQYGNADVQRSQVERGRGERKSDRSRGGRTSSDNFQQSGWRSQGGEHGQAAKGNRRDAGGSVDSSNTGIWHQQSSGNTERNNGRQTTRYFNENLRSKMEAGGSFIPFESSNSQQDFAPSNSQQGFASSNSLQGFVPSNSQQGFASSNSLQVFSPSNSQQGFASSNSQLSSMTLTHPSYSFTSSISTGYVPESNYVPFAGGLSQQPVNAEFSFREGTESASVSALASGHYGTNYGNIYGGLTGYGNNGY